MKHKSFVSERNINVVATATIPSEPPEQTVNFRSCTGSREPIDALWGQQVPIVASDLFTETFFEAERLASINNPEPAVQRVVGLVPLLGVTNIQRWVMGNLDGHVLLLRQGSERAKHTA